MPNISDKASEQYDKTVGSAKENIGDVIGDSELKAEGQTQNAAGETKGVMNSIGELAQNVSNQVQGTIQGIYNALSGSSSGGGATGASGN
jgi:uncharacterized protein YjbJ (UPF0337 family)